MEISAYLYDANGTDETVELTEEVFGRLNDDKMLWVDVSKREKEAILKIAAILKLKNIPLKQLLSTTERPKLDKFENFYHFFITSVDSTDENELKPIPIDFIVGNNFIVTIHEGEVPYFKEFRELEKGESQLGELDTEGFVTTFLDLHIVSYFQAIEKIEHLVDKFDEIILRTDIEDKTFLERMVKLRRKSSKLRHWFVPQRDVFYALARPDFRPTAESDYVEDTFRNLNQHFENAVDAIENSRDTVLSLFDLYTTRASYKMNTLMKRLTFITLVVGGLGAIAGIWGMNFEVSYFKAAETGFWLTMLSMGLFILGAVILGKFSRWI